AYYQPTAGMIDAPGVYHYQLPDPKAAAPVQWNSIGSRALWREVIASCAYPTPHLRQKIVNPTRIRHGGDYMPIMPSGSRVRPATGFIEPCLPTVAKQAPT